MANKGTQLIKTVFNTDNKVMRICERIFDLCCLNLIFLMTCLPIITIGVSKISLYRVLIELRQAQHVPILKSYMTAFKGNLKIGFALFILEATILGIIGLDLYLIYLQNNFPFLVMKVICLGLLFLVLLFSLISYPIAAKTKLSLRGLLRQALIQLSFNMMKNFAQLAILLVLIFCYTSSIFTIVFGSLFFLIIGFSSLAYLQLKLIERMVTPNLDKVL